MKVLAKRLILASMALAVVFVASCSVQANRRTRELEQIAAGDTVASVVARLGQPSERVPAGQPFLRYTDLGCIAPCVVRLWWEWPLFRGIEAWSVDLDSDQRVLTTYHWVSP
jgi:hypothetical protein